jgi:hypothetical protein
MASRPEIIAEIEALEVHCRAPLMTTDARARWFQDWCADLNDFPIETIRSAIRDWRHSGSTKFPTPGALLPLIRAKLPREASGDAPKAWRPLSDEEYAQLSVREKIRHQTILAHEASVKAGPMWRNPPGSNMSRPMPGHIRAEDMPDTWRRWRDVAAGHMAEATRLRKYLRQQPVAAE